MTLRFAKARSCEDDAGFTLAETLMSFLVFGFAVSGVIYGYVQINRMAEWSSMALAAQSNASQGAERARAADWRPWGYPPTNGPGTMDELPPGTNGSTAFAPFVDYMDIPIKGSPAATDFAFWVTNYVWVSNISSNPPLRQIQSDCVVDFPADRPDIHQHCHTFARTRPVLTSNHRREP